ncbi:ABC transporter substrate-binding protein [Streptomyces paludis]|uniref:Amino acid ABC transporter substrate-binding protein n=1 Tax=Streptomyces paludis TaxID=2282738 RepID=A0A345HPP5_9ACTN|nr:ABC transporter substrate-binding protein [Streptomyces paludis]AXG78669.1 amino acid ABC transporter substrate-binding protein [Streptomyces paludis]
MTTSLADDLPDANPPVPRWRFAALGAVVLLLLGGGAFWLFRPESTDCAEGVRRVEAGNATRCVGLTDGSYPFTKDLRTVFRLVEKENRQVTEEAAQPGGTPYVSVVYLMGMSPRPGDSKNTESVRHELEGAYTAQYEANHRRAQGRTPRIRLLLGDTGSRPEQRAYTLEQIRARLDRDRIVAVAGAGTSLGGTREMVARLNSWDIASFGSVLTSDVLEKSAGLVRVAPPNADQAAAAVRYLSREEYAGSKVLIVKDSNNDDLYTKTLAEKFGAGFPEPRLAAPEPMQYDSSKTQLATYFSNQMPNLCLERPDVVYFAGRGRDLPDFLAPLSERQCSGSPLMVLSGDDTSQVLQADGFNEVKQSLRKGNIRLVFTGLAHPGAWDLAPRFFDPNAIGPFLPDGTFRTTFRDDKLDDGQAIMGHDAVRTAVKAIRKAVPLENSDQRIERKDVMQNLSLLYDANAVAGASGWISLKNNGSPRDKAIPLIEIDGTGSTKTIAVVSGGDAGTPYLPKSAGPG